MKIEKNKVVSLTYSLNAEDENGHNFFIESIEPENPVVFLFGASGFPEKFEEELNGLEPQNEFDFKLLPDDAYGTKDEQAVVFLSKDIFMEEGTFNEERFQVGTVVPMTDADGHSMHARVLKVADKELLMDFNHPLAGLTLLFSGKIIDVRDATQDELAHGHVHGEGGHHH